MSADSPRSIFSTAGGLRAVLEAADELVTITDPELLRRRVVELAREKLGAERCSLYLDTGGLQLIGTYGTDLEGRTTDERGARIERHHHQLPLHPPSVPPERRWHRFETEPVVLQGDRLRKIRSRRVWVVVTPIRSQAGFVGSLCNDAAISGAPLNEVLQERLALYASIVGGLIERTENRLRLTESETAYRALFDNSLNAIAVHELVLDGEGQPCDYRYLMANAAFEAMTGLRQPVGRLVSELLREDHQPYVDLFAPVALTGEPLHTEIAAPSLGGVYNATCFQTRPMQFAVVFNDITERHRREAAERERSGRLGRLHQVTAELALAADADELCRRAVVAGRGLLGCDNLSLWLMSPDCGQVRGTFAADHQGRVRDERDIVIPVVDAEPARVLGHGLPSHLSAEASLGGRPAVPPAPDSQLWTGSEVSGFLAADNRYSRRAWSDHDRELLGLFGLAVGHLHALKATEAELRRSEERYRLIVQHSPVGIVQFDPEGRVRACNDELLRLSGWSRTQALQWDLRTLGNRELRAAFEAAMGGSVGAFEGLVRRDDDLPPVRLRAEVRPLRAADGRLMGGLALVEDITERHDLDERLRQAAKMEAVGRLAGGVAHDFNNLLTTILGYSELTLAALEPHSELRADIDAVRRAAERAAGLTRQLLAFSRRQVLQPKVIDLNAVVLDLVEMVKPLLGEDVALVTRLEPVLGRVKADPGQIEQVLMNLVVNARDAMPGGGRLEITTLNAELGPRAGADGGGPFAVVRVRDTGCGMDEATMGRIFEPFFSTKEGKGTGFGLSTSYGIVRQSGGHLTADSQLGAGATFQVWLPICLETADSEAADAPTAAPRGAETVLLVEDQAEVRHLARRALENHGYHVVEADCAETALALAPGIPRLHLLLTDVVMPGLNGVELARRLRAGRPDLPVIFMSGYTDEPVSEFTERDERALFLSKPFSPGTLAHRVRQVLDSV
jgi:PAS domain S-box-containing protein